MINSIPYKWATNTNYGSPQPRYISPVVLINKQMEEIPKGYKIDPCLLPSTILQLDECEQILRVNDAQIDLKGLMPCLQAAAGNGPPTGKPSAGYLPFYADLSNNNKLYIYAGGSWLATS